MKSTPSSASSIFLCAFGSRLAGVLGHQAGAVRLDEVAAGEDAHRPEDVAEQAGHRRLAGARVAAEDGVQADGGGRQAELLACLLHLQVVDQPAHLLLDRSQADQGVQLRQRLVQRSLWRRLFNGLQLLLLGFAQGPKPGSCRRRGFEGLPAGCRGRPALAR